MLAWSSTTELASNGRSAMARDCTVGRRLSAFSEIVTRLVCYRARRRLFLRFTHLLATHSSRPSVRGTSTKSSCLPRPRSLATRTLPCGMPTTRLPSRRRKVTAWLRVLSPPISSSRCELQVSGKLVQNALDAADASLANNAAMIDKTFSSPSQTQHDARASQEEIGRLISGFDTYKTESGDTKTVPYAAATDWWSNSKGQTLGTQGPMAPGPDWNHIQRVNPTGE
jgi:hypothetical protein